MITKDKVYTALILAPAVTALSALPAAAQTAVTTELATADVTGGMNSAIKVVIAALVIWLGYKFFKRAFG